MRDNDLTPIFVGTLQPRFFDGLGLSRQRLALWCKITGFEPKDRPTRKRRQFSPADVFRLATIKMLKSHTRLSITDNRSLIGFLENRAFVTRTLDIWCTGQVPVLLTNLSTIHTVSKASETFVKDLIQEATLWCVVSLDVPVDVMLTAVTRGGTQIQKNLCARIKEERNWNSSGTIEHAKIVDLKTVEEEDHEERLHIFLGIDE